MPDLAAFDLTDSQRYEILNAHDEAPAGLARIIKRAAGANNPTAALISMVRKGAHTEEQSSKGTKPAADTLDDVARIAVRSYNARVAKYPPIDERGWTDDDAIAYGVTVASTWNTRIAQDDIERAMRILIGKPWTSDQDPALGTGCPPELLREILTKLGRIGLMPQPASLPRSEPTLAERLLAMTKEAA